MAALRLGDIETLPASSTRRTGAASATASRCCRNSARSTPTARITDVGRRLARLPVDPRIGRMILQADAEGCVREVLVLAAALSIPDPRERPTDREEAAAAEARPLRRRALRLPLLPQPVALPARAARRALGQPVPPHVPRGVPALPAHPRVAGPRRPAAQHRRATSASPNRTSRPTRPACTPRCWPGCSSHVGLREATRRLASSPAAGARNSRFVLAPGSVLTQAAAAVGRGRRAGRDQPAVRARPPRASSRRRSSALAGHLVQRTLQRTALGRRAAARSMAYERVTLYGLPLVARRRVGYATVEPEVARELFIRHALVEGDWQTRHHFFRDNARAARRTRGARGAGPPPRPARRRRGDLRVLRRARPRRGRRQRPALRRVVEEAAAHDARTC